MPSPQVKTGDCYSPVYTPTLTVHATYAANDYVGTSGVALTLTNAAREVGGSGMITKVEVIDAVIASVAGELWLFDAAPTPPADSAAWTISDDDAAKCIGVVPISTYYASALNSIGVSDNLAIPYACASGSKDLYACFVTRGAPAYAATGNIKFRIHMLRD